MANYMNLPAAFIGFLGASALIYGLWNPVIALLAAFPTPIYVLCGALWVAICILAIVYFPVILLISDDTGN